MSSILEERHIATARYVLQNFEQDGIIEKMTKNFTPLLAACYLSDYKTMKKLLKAGADPNHLLSNQMSPLNMATDANDLYMMRQLLRYGANVNHVDEEYAPLHMAAEKATRKAVEILLEAGVDINLLDGEGRTPLYIACEERNRSVANFLLEQGADVNLSSPIMAVVEGNDVDLFKKMIEKGALFDVFDKSKRNLLMRAVCKGSREMIEEARKRTSDLGHKDCTGKDVFDYLFNKAFPSTWTRR